jgi:hypothetical protein
MKRMWINQPSSLQPLHAMHGTRVLAAPDTDRTYKAYLLDGDAVSMQVPCEALSNGWPKH